MSSIIDEDNNPYVATPTGIMVPSTRSWTAGTWSLELEEKQLIILLFKLVQASKTQGPRKSHQGFQYNYLRWEDAEYFNQAVTLLAQNETDRVMAIVEGLPVSKLSSFRQTFFGQDLTRHPSTAFKWVPQRSKTKIIRESIVQWQFSYNTLANNFRHTRCK